MESLERIRILLAENTSYNRYYIVSLILFCVCSFIILVSVGIKFVEKEQKEIEIKRYCIVSTLTMVLFFLIAVPLFLTQFGVVTMSWQGNLLFFVFGVILTLGGAWFNVYARSYISRFWSDQIVIQKNHELVTDGPYAFVRHPMYSSLILYGLGLSFLFLNYIFLILLCAVFIPMMIVRARQEEKELVHWSALKYDDYKKRTNFLIPMFNTPICYVLRVSAIILFVVVLTDNRVTLDEAIFLGVCYLVMSFVVNNPKVRFSYKIKISLFVLIYPISLIFNPIKYLYYFILAMSVMGLFTDCPGMKLYEAVSLKERK